MQAKWITIDLFATLGLLIVLSIYFACIEVAAPMLVTLRRRELLRGSNSNAGKMNQT